MQIDQPSNTIYVPALKQVRAVNVRPVQLLAGGGEKLRYANYHGQKQKRAMQTIYAL